MIVEGDCLALVMDFVEGGDLGSYRQSSGGTLRAADALRVTAQICDALAAAHV
jgi:serine/threonine-protein kinase